MEAKWLSKALMTRQKPARDMLMRFTLGMIKQMKSHNGSHRSWILAALSRLLCVIMVMCCDKSFSPCPNNSEAIPGRSALHVRVSKNGQRRDAGLEL